MKNEEIATQLDIPVDTLAYWISSKKWKERKDKIKEEAMDSTDENFRQFCRSNRMEVLKRHMEVTRELEDRILVKIRATSPTGRPIDISAGDLVKLATALKNSSDVSARAAGISDRTFDNVPVLSPGSSQVILVGLQPQPVIPAPRTSTATDITAEVEVSESDPF